MNKPKNTSTNTTMNEPMNTSMNESMSTSMKSSKHKKVPGFVLDERLVQDCEWVVDLSLCRVLLMQDSHYPWFILVPMRANVEELYQLSDEDLTLLTRESTLFGESMMQLFKGDKLNVAALGNVVSQLHIHHIVRFRDDAAWPAPVWGKQPAQPYNAGQLAERIKQVRDHVAEWAK